jgi:tetratricopeptide (TPR) repeat protein
MNTLKLNNIVNYYKAVGNYAQAFEYYTKASHCQDDRFDMARIQINIGAIYGASPMIVEYYQKRNVYERAFKY